MSDLQKLIDALEYAAEEAAHDCATRRDVNDLFRARKAVADKVAELEQQLEAALKDAAVPDGFALVPIEPTDEMCEAAWESEGTDYVGEHLRIWQIAPAYRAMIAAAQPKEPT